MKLWVDDMRQPPSNDWVWCKSTNDAISAICYYDRQMHDDTIIIDLDHDAGDYANNGGDYIKILDWLEESGHVDTGYFFRIHSMNVVGIENMKAIIEHNGWRLIK